MRESRIPVKELSQEIGVPVSTINQWVYGRTPRLDAGLLRLARFFNVSLEYLVAGVEREANLTDPIKLLEDTILKVNHRQYRIILEPIVRSAEKKKEE